MAERKATYWSAAPPIDATITLSNGQHTVMINGQHQGTTSTLREAKALVPEAKWLS